MEKPETTVPDPRRKYLYMAISSALAEAGFDSADKECLETLSEMCQSLLSEIGQSSRNYCELSGRTIPVIGDVVIALINMGISIQGLEAFARRDGRHVIPSPQQVSAQKQLNLLQAGTKNAHPSHIPNHLPPLPDPHAYIRTPTHKQPVTEYEAIREKAATQKKDVEKALTKFLAKTSDIHSLFNVEDNMFPLIACKPAHPSYLAALNPTDQVFDFEELEYHYQVANRTEDVPAAPAKELEDDDDDEGEVKEPKEVKIEETEAEPTPSQANNPNIDNPYLRAAIVPKRMKLSEGRVLGSE
ncbi:transcription initiation factor TFIID subunit 8 [Phlebotomus argentipes]|uniref:transcription initiation factor TFIID subunit 8 n=1 Tax=Phlebotomus argentipes TaxID=94469 RepID=UPI0028937F17|nr:transcription initiation factor TFIID subunit 8 [Phlebotomus argentipes]